jgi:hypothetical protein
MIGFFLSDIARTENLFQDRCLIQKNLQTNYSFLLLHPLYCGSLFSVTRHASSTINSCWIHGDLSKLMKHNSPCTSNSPTAEAVQPSVLHYKLSIFTSPSSLLQRQYNHPYWNLYCLCDPFYNIWLFYSFFGRFF